MRSLPNVEAIYPSLIPSLALLPDSNTLFFFCIYYTIYRFTMLTSHIDSTLITATGSSTTHRTSTFTSTLPGGAVTTVTSVEVITPGSSDQATTSSSASGSLQTGLAVPVARGCLRDVLAGVVIGGAILI
ncbi:hypothetical protein F4809DRAFT_635943 [Biscogniauxia mediterranea]|nr:hypothetical protein F4809DRAFT_635943 [Biscogniauxia mediterranea]